MMEKILEEIDKRVQEIDREILKVLNSFCSQFDVYN